MSVGHSSVPGVLAVSCLVMAHLGCGGSNSAQDSGPGQDSGSGGGADAGPLHGFGGSYGMAYSGTWQNTSPNTLSGTSTYASTFTVSQGTATDILVTGTGSTGGFCQGAFNWTGQNTATFSPTAQLCTFTVPSGPCAGESQTNTRDATATFSNSSPPTLTITYSNGTYTASGAPCGAYAGNYAGSWTGSHL